MAIKRSKAARGKRDSLRAKYVDTKSYSAAGWACKRAAKLYGKKGTVYQIGMSFYAGKKSNDPYLKERVSKQCSL